MKWLELKIPPPIVAILCAAGMWIIANNTPHYSTTPITKWGFVIFFILLGAIFDIAGLLEFRRSKTTVNPLHPEKSSTLVSGGIYKITRNPMYCGMAALLLAWAVYLQSPLSVASVLLFIGYITQFQIKPEERMLTGIFGDAFIQYQQRVRRWL